MAGLGVSVHSAIFSGQFQDSCMDSGQYEIRHLPACGTGGTGGGGEDVRSKNLCTSRWRVVINEPSCLEISAGSMPSVSNTLNCSFPVRGVWLAPLYADTPFRPPWPPHA